MNSFPLTQSISGPDPKFVKQFKVRDPNPTKFVTVQSKSSLMLIVELHYSRWIRQLW